MTDQAIKDFWYKEFLPLPPSIKSEAISPIVNKTGLINIHPIIRGVLGKSKSDLQFNDVMNTKKIFIANLSKGYLGEDGTQFLGSLLLTQFQTSALQRADQEILARVPFYLYIDEMHSFVTLSLADILSEARKYGLCLFLTHQFLDQLSLDIRNAILGNIGTLICFRVGALDAETLEKEFYPVFSKDDLVKLPQYHIYLKLMIDGTTSQPFSAVTLPITSTKQGHKSRIIRNCQTKNKTQQDKAEYNEFDSNSLFNNT